MEIPSDADGDAMRRVLAHGADITRPMLIDFQIDCPDVESAKAIASRVPPEEFSTKIYTDSEDGSVTCECSRQMLLAYAEMIRIQQQLTTIARPFGGFCEAWGTFGNSKSA
jgi:Regulator of ribonuclease activity B